MQSESRWPHVKVQSQDQKSTWHESVADGQVASANGIQEQPAANQPSILLSRHEESSFTGTRDWLGPRVGQLPGAIALELRYDGGEESAIMCQADRDSPGLPPGTKSIFIVEYPRWGTRSCGHPAPHLAMVKPNRKAFRFGPSLLSICPAILGCHRNLDSPARSTSLSPCMQERSL